METVTAQITVQNKKYPYTLTKKRSGIVHMLCDAAGISQNFPAEDIPALLIDLPNLILDEKQYREKQSEVVRFRISGKHKKKLQQKALRAGYRSLSDYLRAVALQ